MDDVEQSMGELFVFTENILFSLVKFPFCTVLWSEYSVVIGVIK